MKVLWMICGLMVAGSVWAQSVATTPADRLKEAWWQKRFEEKLNLPDRKNAELVFLGDSITQGWEGSGKPVWEKYYAGRKSLNLGFSGDKTENVLWRLDNGEVDGLSPKLVVLMIGTNNTGHRKDKPADIAAGVKAICDKLQAKLPKTKILVEAIFPRSASPTDPARVNNDTANQLIAQFAGRGSFFGRRIYYLDINKDFLQPDGTLTHAIMPDLLHPQQQGYEIWAKAIEPTVAKLLGDKPIK